MTIRVALDCSFLQQHPHSGMGTYTRTILTMMHPERRVTIIPFSEKGGRLGTMHLVRASAIERIPLDLVHYPYSRLPATRHPALVTLHDLIPLAWCAEPWRAVNWQFTNVRSSRDYLTLLRGLRQGSAELVTVSQAAAGLIRRLGKFSPERLHVIPNAVDLDRFVPNPPHQDDHPVTIMHVGGQMRRKNVMTLLRAWAELSPAARGNSLMILVGEYDNKDQPLVRLRHHGLLERTIVVTHPDDRQLAEWYRRADILAIPSHLEGFGIPLIEGMAAGCALVVSDRPEFHEVAGDAARYANPGSARAWRNALEELIANGRQRKMLVAQGQRRVRTYGLPTVARQLTALYLSCARHPSSPKA